MARRRKPGSRRIEFHVPRLFAGVLAKGASEQRPLEDVARDVLKLQWDLYVVCSSCGHKTSPIVIWKRGDVAPLYRLAMTTEYEELITPVRRKYRQFLFTCPKCGHEARLPEGTWTNQAGVVC